MGGTGTAVASDSQWGALAYPNYRRYWFAAIVRVFGIQFRFIGAGWLVAVELDQSPFWLGMVWLATSLPTILLSIPAGSLADRTDPYRLLVSSQFMSFIGHLVLAMLIVTGTVTLWMVIVWALATGSFAALAAPSMSAILPRLIERKVMASAVALNSGVWGAMRIVGPAASGVLIALVGTGQAFLVAAVATAISVVVLLTLHLPPRTSVQSSTDQGGVMTGLRFIWSRPVFLSIIGLSFFTSVFGSSYVVLLPIFAEYLLNVGATGFGMLEAAAGVGALAGTYVILRHGIGSRPGLVMFGFAAIFGVLVALFAATDSLAPAALLLLLGGFAEEIFLVIGMTVLQLAVPDQLRGRVMGIWTMTYFLASIGGFIAGIAAEVIGVRVTIAAGSLAVTAFALVAYFAASELRTLRGDSIIEDSLDPQSGGDPDRSESVAAG
ncbi:MAG: MFS transporter [Chloroflexi bacterium]|nr:MFS transporter [Chloroflexota bacterium]MDA1146501.1 MFS transporter [Chloroflexota bacterium]